MEIIRKILIVDDRHENLLALERFLDRIDNLQIIRAYSGNEALAKTLEHEFSLALIDVQMPEMDGYETVSLMRQVEKTRFLPVIFLSAIYSEEQYKIQGIEAGAVDFITKPFHPRLLLGKIRVFLDLYDQRKRLEIEIEQRKQIEKSLTEAKLKAEESDKLKTAFLANMSHEIRTPLTTIVGFASLLSEVDMNRDKKAEFANYIQKSSESLINIINDILDIAKIEAGQLRILKTPLNIGKVLKELQNTFSEKLARKSRGNLKILLNIPGDIPENIVTDNTRLRQIITNLLSNAEKFTLEGTIELGCSVNDNSIFIYVNDTGVGIPEDKLDLIFERFEKLENDKIKNPAGTGLGLSIAKKLAELLGGRIIVESIPDKGSRFTLELPLLISHDHKNLQPGNTLPGEMDWSSKNILIVEDEYTTYILLESLLVPTHAKLTWAKNGKEALDTYLNDGHYDAILMDINMPVMNGIEAFNEFRKIDKNLPIIAQTAYAMIEDRHKFNAMGFNGYIAKPIMKKDLFHQLNAILK